MPTVTTYPGVFGPYTPITFTRASTATYFDSTGTLQSAAIDSPRLDYDPSTLAAQGLLIEEARTNSIRNNTMQGAVAGTPGTLPTNWSWGGTATYAVVATGTESGITYVDLRIQGASAADTWNLFYDVTNQVAAANGQSWTGSVYFKLVAGSTANLPFIQRLVFRDSGLANIQQLDSSALAPTTANLRTQRSTISLTATQAATAFVTLQLNSGTPTGAFDITLRIGLPQLEQGAFATSVIPTTTTALTRSADVASVNTLSPWYNATEGTLYAQASLISSSYSQGVLVDLGAGGAFGTTEYMTWSGTGWILSPNTPPINVTSSVATTSTAKVAAGLKANDSVISANGLIGVTDTSCGIVAAPTTLSIGKGGWALGNFFNGWIQRITYYPRRLSNAELQAITA